MCKAGRDKPQTTTAVKNVCFQSTDSGWLNNNVFHMFKVLLIYL